MKMFIQSTSSELIEDYDNSPLWPEIRVAHKDCVHQDTNVTFAVNWLNVILCRCLIFIVESHPALVPNEWGKQLINVSRTINKGCSGTLDYLWSALQG